MMDVHISNTLIKAVRTQDTISTQGSQITQVNLQKQEESLALQVDLSSIETMTQDTVTDLDSSDQDFSGHTNFSRYKTKNEGR